MTCASKAFFSAPDASAKFRIWLILALVMPSILAAWASFLSLPASICLSIQIAKASCLARLDGRQTCSS
ncbi:MAG: hypothetical protein EYC70_07045 [Planctomycetota bacterium]|nr:MAG: hypothetical protein EYC70_07045 [Planctomycetota bacterium]